MQALSRRRAAPRGPRRSAPVGIPARPAWTALRTVRPPHRPSNRLLPEWFGGLGAGPVRRAPEARAPFPEPGVSLTHIRAWRVSSFLSRITLTDKRES